MESGVGFIELLILNSYLTPCSQSIITYVMLCGYSPIRADDPKEMVAETARGDIQFHDRYWSKISQEGASALMIGSCKKMLRTYYDSELVCSQGFHTCPVEGRSEAAAHRN